MQMLDERRTPIQSYLQKGKIDFSFFEEFLPKTRIEKVGVTDLDLSNIQNIQIPLCHLTFSEHTKFPEEYQKEASQLLYKGKSFFREWKSLQKEKDCCGLKVGIIDRITSLEEEQLDVGAIHIIPVEERMKEEILEKKERFIAKKNAFPHELTNILFGKELGMVSHVDQLYLYSIPTFKRGCKEHNPRKMTVDLLLQDMKRNHLELDLVIFPSYFYKSREKERELNDYYLEQFKALNCVFFSSYLYDDYFISGKYDFLNYDRLVIGKGINWHEVAQMRAARKGQIHPLLLLLNSVEKSHKVKKYQNELQQNPNVPLERWIKIYQFVLEKIDMDKILVPGGNHTFIHEGQCIYQGGVHDNIAGICYISALLLMSLKKKNISLKEWITIVQKTSKKREESPDLINPKALLEEIK